MKSVAQFLSCLSASNARWTASLLSPPLRIDASTGQA